MKNALKAINAHKIYFIAATLIFITDIVSKHFVDKYIKAVQVKEIIGNYLVFVYTRNYGVAFGMLNNLPESIRPIVLMIIPFIVFITAVIVAVLICKLDVKKNRISLIGLTMIFGGALGNFVDRLMRGYVTDFINMGITDNIRFNYNYNIADASITIGIIIILIAMFFFKEDISDDKKKTNNENSENKA